MKITSIEGCPLLRMLGRWVLFFQNAIQKEGRRYSKEETCRAHIYGPDMRLGLPYYSFSANICVPPIWTKGTNCHTFMASGINKLPVPDVDTNMCYSMT